MSIKNVKAFFEKVEQDKSLKKKLESLDRKASQDQAAALNELATVASAAGFKFTVEDYLEAKVKVSENVSRELGDKEMSQVTGGYGTCNYCNGQFGNFTRLNYKLLPRTFSGV